MQSELDAITANSEMLFIKQNGKTPYEWAEHYRVWENYVDFRNTEKAVLATEFRWVYAAVGVGNNKVYRGFFGCDSRGFGIWHWNGVEWILLDSRKTATRRWRCFIDRLETFFGFAYLQVDMERPGGRYRNWPPVRNRIRRVYVKKTVKSTTRTTEKGNISERAAEAYNDQS
jgi:hypothetical protein